ncbi:MAG: hypothetical protein KKD18_04145 [Nanoarchaeota archaeon]|nr:hypothetical protein [Nanoarchaeota archaeon]
MINQNKQLLTFLKEKLGTSLKNNMALILTGSRTLGLEDKKSDYDCYLIYEKKDKKKIKNKFLTKNWMIKNGGIWTNLENENEEQVALMTKTFDEIKNEKQMTMQYVYSKATVLFDPSKKYTHALNSLKKKIDIGDELKNSYLNFMLNLSLLTGILRKNYSLPVAYFKKGDVIRDLMKLSILIDKKPYPYEKVLYWEFSKSKSFKKIKNYIEKIKKLGDANKAKKLRKELVNYVNQIMPKEEYVGKNWWRFEK